MDRFEEIIPKASVSPRRHCVDYADSLEERELRFHAVAAALAARGQGSEALKWVDAIGDPKRKAWALWEVASELKD